MALSFHPTTASLFGHRLPAPDAADMMSSSFLHQDDHDHHHHSEVTEALLGFVYDPLDASNNAALDDLLNLPLEPDYADMFLTPLDDDGATTEADDPHYSGKRQRFGTATHQQVPAMTGARLIKDEYVQQLPLPPIDADMFLTSPDGATDRHSGKRQRIGTATQQVPAMTGAQINNEYYVEQLPPPPPPAVLVPMQVPESLVFVRGAEGDKADSGGACGDVHKSAAKLRRKRISEKTAELARLIPGAQKLHTAEMLEEAARHVKLLQAQVGVLALMRAAGSSKMQEEEMASSAMAAQERMHALLSSGSVQELLAAEGKCLVPTSLVDAVAKDDAVRANPVVCRDLGRFVASLQQKQQEGQ